MGHGASGGRVDAGVDQRPLPIDAYSSHARAVAALLCDAVATRSGHEMAGFVPRGGASGR
jgi:hypothetical protein